MKKRDLLTLNDLTTSEIRKILDTAFAIKKRKEKYTHKLKGKAIGLLFQKPSNRTRVSFEVGIYQMGGTCLYLSPHEINLGVRESTSDVAKTLSRYLDGLVVRTFSHRDTVELAKHGTIPIVNGLSDSYHPCQALADIFSIWEKFKTFKKLTLAYIGDGNNVCHSLLLGCAKVGINMHIATPKGYEPSPEVVSQAKRYAKASKASLFLTNTPQEAIKKANVVYTDVWVSMGQEEETKKRLNDFKGFQVNAKLAKSAHKDFIFMHCLPAHRGQEVTSDVIDGPHSIVFDQAENRLHVQKAILDFLIK